MATLTLSELSKKRPNKPSRFLILLDKVKAGGVFPLNNKTNQYDDVSSVILEPSPEFINVLEDVIKRHNSGYVISAKDFKQFAKGNALYFPLATPIFKGGKEITTIPSSSLIKTKEFGGDETQKSLNKEIIAYGQLNDLIKQATDNGANPINIRVIDSKDRTIKNLKDVTSVVRTNGSNNSPISDFEILNKSGETVCYISHKWGSDPTDFGQYTGVSQTKRNKIYSHKETIAFVKSIKNWLESISMKYGDGSIKNYMQTNISNPLGDSIIDLGYGKDMIYNFPPGITIGKVIKDEKLKRMAMFGQDIVDTQEKDGISKSRSHNAVDFLAQGKFSLQKIENGSEELSTGNSEWILKAYKIVSSDVDVKSIEESYEPIFIAKYDSDRRDLGIQNCRVLIYTKEGRTVKQYVKENN